MKKFIAVFALALSFVCTSKVEAQTTIKWPSGSMTALTTETITTLTTTMTPMSITNNATYKILTVDTGLVLRATINSGVKAGALLYVSVTNNTDAATHAVTGSTGITMASYTLTSAKTHLFTFIYDGTNFINTGVIKTN